MKSYFAVVGVMVAFSMMVSTTVQAKTIKFSGRTWNVKTGYSSPGKNNWSDTSEGVYVDKSGSLHLKVFQRNGAWYSSEVSMPAPGYGTYEFDIRSPITNLDINTVASPFIYKDDAHEIDIEYTKWKVADQYNTYNSVQPVRIDGADTKFNTKAKPGMLLIGRIIWEPTKITIENLQNGKVLNTWTYTGARNFSPAGATVNLNHWLIDGDPPTDNKSREFVVGAMRFKPYTGPIPQEILDQSAEDVSVGLTKEEHIAAWRDQLKKEQDARRRALIEKIGIDEYLKFEQEMMRSTDAS